MVRNRVLPKFCSYEHNNLMRDVLCFNKQDVIDAYNKYIGSIYYEVKEGTDEEIEEIDKICDTYGYEYKLTTVMFARCVYRKYIERWRWIE